MSLRVATFNIRTATAPDGWNAWRLRRRATVAAIRALDADVVAVQEVQPPQLAWLERHLGDDHVIVSRGRVAPDRGERTAVVVRRPGAIEHVDARWYSEQPSRPGSRGWGSRFPRFALLARVALAGHDPFLLVSTHFDHASQPSREAAGGLLAGWVAADGDPGRAIVCGDTNCPTDDPALRPLLDLPLHDALAGVPTRGPGSATFHRFRGGDDTTRIDQVLVGRPGWRVRDATIVRHKVRGRWPSDHYPVVVSLEASS